MRYVLIAVAVAIVAVTFVVLSNSLTITVNSRKKFMARLTIIPLFFVFKAENIRNSHLLFVKPVRKLVIK